MEKLNCEVLSYSEGDKSSWNYFMKEKGGEITIQASVIRNLKLNLFDEVDIKISEGEAYKVINANHNPKNRNIEYLLINDKHESYSFIIHRNKKGNTYSLVFDINKTYSIEEAVLPF